MAFSLSSSRSALMSPFHSEGSVVHPFLWLKGLSLHTQKFILLLMAIRTVCSVRLLQSASVCACVLVNAHMHFHRVSSRRTIAETRACTVQLRDAWSSKGAELSAPTCSHMYPGTGPVATQAYQYLLFSIFLNVCF